MEALRNMGLGGLLAQAAQAAPTLQDRIASAKPRMALRPFNSSESVNNPDGSISTERTVTVQTPDGWVNVPSLWMGPNGPVDMMTMPDAEARIGQLLRMFEAENGPSFQRFRSVDEAVTQAKARSNAGGAKSGQKR